MSNTNASSELRLFLSSTFRDLQEEREHLVRKIFPEIRALCRERGVVFTEIDLRWGLTEEEGTLGRIIGACLDEVDRCRPWFIGIFGSRYGWVPPFREIYKDPDLLRRHPWLEEGGVDGMSIMEMEVRHALGRYPGSPSARPVSDGTASPNILFYRRVDRSRPGVPAEPVDERLERLVADVTAAGYPVREFRSPESLGEMVYDDLTSLIDRDFSRSDASELQIERFDHEAFAVSRRQAYIPNADLLGRLDSFAAEEATEESDTVLVIRAPSGLGKSALLSYWARRYRMRNPDAFIVEHYIGIGSGSGTRTDIVRHILREIRERGGIREEIPENPDQLLPLLPEWFSMLGDDRMVLLLDGANQLPENERDLSWIPGHIPQSVRLIITTTEPLRDELGEVRTWPELLLDPLDVDEREAVVVRFLGEFHKGLSPDRIRQIASAPQTAEPLYLRTLLEELRVGGLHEHLDRAIGHYLTAEDTPALFRHVLARLEEDFGLRRVREVMSLIWCSRKGLSDTELTELTLISRLQLNLFLTALDYHLVRRSGLYTFFHDHLARAVEERYLPDVEVKRSCHYRIGQYFSTTPVTDRRLDEEPWAWVEADDLERLKACVTDPDIFRAMSGEEWKYELIRYWRGFEIGELMGGYDRMLENLTGSPAAEIDALRTLGEILLIIGESKQAETYIGRALERVEMEEDPERRVDCLLAMGNCRIALGEYQKAEEVLREALALSHEIQGTSNPRVVDCLITLATALYERSHLDESARLFEDGLKMSEEMGDARRAFECASGLGAVWYREKKFDDALHYFEMSSDIVEEQGWWKTLRGAECMNNLGAVYREQGHHEKAEVAISQALQIHRSILGELNSMAIRMVMNHGNILENLGEIKRAETALRHALNLERSISGIDHPQTALRMVQLAIFLMYNSNLKEAEALLAQAESIQHLSLGPNHPRALQTRCDFAEVRSLQGHKSESLSIYEDVLPKKRELLGADHPSYLKSYNLYLSILSENQPDDN